MKHYFVLNLKETYEVSKTFVKNGYHIETINDEKNEYLYIAIIVSGKNYVLKKLLALFSSLYYTNINMIETHAILNKKFTDPNIFIIWHDWLGHLGSILMRKTIENSHRYLLKN